MLRSFRLFRPATRNLVSAVLLCGAFALSNEAPAQTAPQLLPYTSKLIAGGGSTGATAGAACSRAGAAPSGNSSTDAYGDGCLATEITLSAPRHAVVDKTGAVFFSDNTNALIRRVDPVTGIVTVVAGGGSTTPSGTAAAPKACGGTDPNSSTDAMGDGCLGTSVKLGHPGFLVFSTSGDLYFSDPYNYDVRKIAATGGVITTTGVISTVVGNNGGSSASSYGYSAGCSITSTTAATACVLRSPYGIAFDSFNDLIIVDEYYYAVLAVNLNTAGTTTLANVSLPAGVLTKIAGSKASGAACVNGTASSSGCAYGSYTNGASATASTLDNPYGVAVDATNNVYVTDQYYDNVLVINSAGNVNSFAGAYPLTHTTGSPAQTTRAKPTFAFGVDYGVASDTNSNIYIPDATNGYVWRVDGAGGYMYVVAGAGTSPTPTVAGTACPNNSAFTATDAVGDGCPALSANYKGTGIFGLSADTNGNVFLADQSNSLIREVASGTQFGPIGASQTDYIVVHFAAGDGPLKSGGFAITLGQTIFTIGTTNSTTNSDNTTDVIVPITAAPSASGAFSGTLTVYSNLVPLGTAFPLTGTFVQSPVTRTVVATSSTSTASCGSGSTYPTNTPVTLTANVTANGPHAAAGTFTFYSNGTQIGTPQTVANNSASLSYTFTAAGTYSITATFTPAATETYFLGSTSAPVSLTATTATFTAAPTTFKEATVSAGGTALYSFTLSQTLYSGTISFACSGLPANSSCSFSPQTIAATGCTTTNTVAMSIITQQAVKPLPASLMPGGRWTLLTAISGISLMLLVSLRRKGSAMRFGRIGLLCGLLVALTGITACGSGTQGTAGTPTGTSNVLVTATGSTGTTASFTVQLTVQ